VLSCILSTVCSGQTATVDTTDKICLTPTEFNFFIGAAYDSHTYKIVIDSLRKMKSNYDIIVANDSIIKNDCLVLVEAQKETIEATKDLSDVYKAKYESEEKKKRFWQKVAGGVGIVGAAIGIKPLIKP
jgi:hypothetical protein